MTAPVGATAVSEMIAVHNRIVAMLYATPWMSMGTPDTTIRCQVDDNGTITSITRPYHDMSGTYRITQQIHTTYKIEKVEKT